MYQDQDPTQVFYRGKPMRIITEDGHYVMEIPMPFASREELETWINGDELVIKYKNFKRNLILPRALAKQELGRAELKDHSLRLYFEGEKNASNR